MIKNIGKINCLFLLAKEENRKYNLTSMKTSTKVKLNKSDNRKNKRSDIPSSNVYTVGTNSELCLIV